MSTHPVVTALDNLAREAVRLETQESLETVLDAIEHLEELLSRKLDALRYPSATSMFGRPGWRHWAVCLKPKR